MPNLRPRLPNLCSFLYPSQRTQLRPLLTLANLQHTQLRKYATETQMRHDVGLLPGTFVMPSGPRKPSLFRTPRLRMRLEGHRLKTKLKALWGCISYKYFLKRRPWPKLRRRKIAPEAKNLYEKMYTAFADGDTATLRSVCLEGLLGSFRARIKAQPSKERLKWTLHRYIGYPRIVSTNIVRLEIQSSAIYQVVVKIKSLQSLVKVPANGTTSDATVEKKIEEYVVLQRTMLKGKEGNWKIWGTIEESKVEDVLGDNAGAAALSVGKR